MGKPWYLSKTIWVNGLTAVAGVLAAVAGAEFLDGTQTAAVLAMVLGAVNVFLRAITDEPIKTS